MRRARCIVALVLVALASMILPGCTSDDDPEGELVAALQRTLEDSVAFRFTVEADADALRGLGEGATSAAAFLGGFSVSGARGDDGSTLLVQLLGSDVLEVHRPAADRTYVRLGLRDVPGLPAELLDPSTLLPALTQLGVGPEVESAVATLLTGAWIEIAGELDAEALREVTGGPDAPTDGPALDEVFGEDLDARVRRFVDVTERTEDGDRRTYRIVVQLRELARAAGEAGGTLGGLAPDGPVDGDLSSIPEVLPGSVFVVDGVVTRVRLDVGALSNGQDQAGTIELQLDLTDHGSVDLPPPPPTQATVPAEQVLDALATLLRFATGVGGAG